MKEHIILLCHLGYFQEQKTLQNMFSEQDFYLFVCFSLEIMKTQRYIAPELVNPAAQSFWEGPKFFPCSHGALLNQFALSLAGSPQYPRCCHSFKL